MCKKSCELYDTDFDRGGFVGVAIAGYGEEEIYPHFLNFRSFFQQNFGNSKNPKYLQQISLFYDIIDARPSPGGHDRYELSLRNNMHL